MRQVRKNTSGNEVQGGFPKEGMSEGPVKGWRRFSEGEISYIKRRRAELILAGEKDRVISGILAVEMDRAFGSVRQKISDLVASGDLMKNPRKMETPSFSEEEISLMRRRRAELILEGKVDKQIARVLALEMDRSFGSIREKFRRLIEKGELDENPGKMETHAFEEEDVAYIKRRRAELVLGGKGRKMAARVLAEEMGRSLNSILGKIRKLVSSGDIEGNAHKEEMRDFSKEEVACITKRRVELILNGKGDRAIANALAAEMGRSAGSIELKIYRLIGKGKLGENPNKIKRREFGEEDSPYIKKRRAELILEGKNDWQIAKVLAAEIERSAGSIMTNIHTRVKSGELGENPNKQEFSVFGGEELAHIKKRRAELILLGKTDNAIGDALASEMNRSSGVIKQKIFKFIRNGELGENPNRQGKQISEEELAAELSAAVDMYLGDSP